MQKTITAVFRGTDKSCGFEKRMEYTLQIHHSFKKSAGTRIAIFNVNNSQQSCEYDSVISFLNNWDSIRSV